MKNSLSTPQPFIALLLLLPILLAFTSLKPLNAKGYPYVMHQTENLPALSLYTDAVISEFWRTGESVSERLGDREPQGATWVDATSSGPIISDSIIEVTATGTVYVPANLIRFMITISVEDDDTEAAYRSHSDRTSFLTRQILTLSIPEEQIQYQPVRIRPFTLRDQSRKIRTDQRVVLTLKSTDQYIQLQQLLIDEGFDTFSADFSSDQLEQAGREAITEAVESATRIAGIMASAAGVTLGGIRSMSYGKRDAVYPALPRAEMMASPSSPELTDFAQQIPVHQNVTLVFSFEE